MKVFMIVAVCLAASVSGEAEPEPWLAYGYGLHQQTWPSAGAPGVSSTCYGCRRPDTLVGYHGYHYLGKRSAEAEPEPYYGYGLGYYGHPYGLGYRGYYGLPVLPAVAAPALAKAAAAVPTGVAGHPGAATSYVSRSPQGLRGKRSAEPYYGYGLGYYGHPYGLGYRGYYGYGGVAGHPTGTSYVARSPQGLGK